MDKLPSSRTWLKFGRGILLAAVASGAAFVGTNYQDLNIPPETAVFIVPFVGFLYRYARERLGLGPAK
jgi:hypothetical protein